ncbi:MAG: hypothetical protein IPH07_34500 [Deltaproteobacteria bacterium]|nr:hypothetical protein [Deltaproteobacteria bacterium]MBK8235291.1 hypothetical protein [Deltaproteobacteria bacterium]MBK8716389.1 hypothetical protein [Deltaproteobacteria bacterium]MBP7287889.1 hypothetical protein [Nannocystaceae bacterium]
MTQAVGPILRAVLGVASSLSLACDPATPTVPPTSSSATNIAPQAAGVQATSASPCAGKRASPLLLQVDATQQSSIAQAMSRDLAVVAFDCTSITVLESCRLEGRYRFVAGRRDEIQRRVSSAEDAAASLWGAATPPLTLEPGETLELRAIAIGQQRADVAGASAKLLAGDCAKATHFIRSARIGAYELTGRVGTTKHESKSGDLTTCPGDGVRTRLPPPQCSGPLQLELVPIGP